MRRLYEEPGLDAARDAHRHKERVRRRTRRRTKKILDQAGVKLIADESFETTQTNFGPQFAKITDAKPQLLLVWATARCCGHHQGFGGLEVGDSADDDGGRGLAAVRAAGGCRCGRRAGAGVDWRAVAAGEQQVQEAGRRLRGSVRTGEQLLPAAIRLGRHVGGHVHDHEALRAKARPANRSGTVSTASTWTRRRGTTRSRRRSTRGCRTRRT